MTVENAVMEARYTISVHHHHPVIPDTRTQTVEQALMRVEPKIEIHMCIVTIDQTGQQRKKVAGISYWMVEGRCPTVLVEVVVGSCSALA